MRKTIVLLSVLMFFLVGTAQATGGRVRLIVMDGVNLEHLDSWDLPNFRFILDQGAVGLANANTAGGRNPKHAALTLGAGSRALGSEGSLVLGVTEEMEMGTAGEVYFRRTGIDPPQGSLVMPFISSITEANEELHYTVRLGYLADRVIGSGRSVAALVNGDGEDFYRPAASILADNRGIVPLGFTGPELVASNSTWPFGLQSNLDEFSQWLDEYRDVDLLVLDPGDLNRAIEYYPFVNEERRNLFRHQALVQLDRLLGLVLEQHGDEDLILVTSLQADRELGAEEGKWLVPVIAYGGDFSPGLLTSPTTRRQGIVANIDIAPAILNHFGLYQAGEIHGQPLSTIEHPGALEYLLRRDMEMARVFTWRTPLIRGFIGTVIILVGLSVAALIFKWRSLDWLQIIITAVAATPLVLLLLGAIPGSIWTLPVWIGLAFGIAFRLKGLEPGRAMRLLGAVTAITVVVDALFAGAYLQQRSLLGYDAISGARYYGIGNEFMGVLMGSTLLAVSELLVRDKKWAGLIFGAVVLVLMLPGVGANFGGTLAASIGFGVALVGTSPLRNKKHRRVAVLIGLAAGASLVLFNILGDQSHVGRFFVTIAQDPSEFFLAVQRKLEMNWMLIRWSLWSRAFAALFMGALWLLFANRQLMAKRLGAHWPGVRGAMAAALAALLLNDSGVVAAATTLVYLTFPLLYYEFSSSSLVTKSHSA